MPSSYTHDQADEDDARLDEEKPGNFEVAFMSGGEGRLKVVLIDKVTRKRMAARVENDALPAIAEVIRLIWKKKVPSKDIPWKLKRLAGW